MVQLNSSEVKDLYYPNKKILWSNGILYHPNGLIAWDGLMFLFRNEQIAFVNKHLYHFNGEIAWNGNTGYNEDGTFLTNFGVAVKISQGMYLKCNKNWVGISIGLPLDIRTIDGTQFPNGILIILKEFNTQ
jgi:hypothetical protein